MKETVREAGPLFGLQTFARDMLYGVRNLRPAPGFTLATTLSLALWYLNAT